MKQEKASLYYKTFIWVFHQVIPQSLLWQRFLTDFVLDPLNSKWMWSTLDIKWCPNTLLKLFIIQNWISIRQCSKQPNDYL